MKTELKPLKQGVVDRTKEEQALLIKETVEYYSKNLRGSDGLDACVYKGVDGSACAVGRCMSSESLQLLGDHDGRIDSLIEEAISKFNFNSFDQLLLPEYTGFSINLFESLQQLHDTRYYFEHNFIDQYTSGCAGNLTMAGINYLEHIINSFQLTDYIKVGYLNDTGIPYITLTTKPT